MKKYLLLSITLLITLISSAQLWLLSGSSTPAGMGADTTGKAWPEQVAANAVAKHQITSFINASKFSTTYEVAMPNGDNPSVDTNMNIDRAIKLKAKYFSISFNNGYDYMDIHKVLSDFRKLKQHADSFNVQFWMTTDQPKSSVSDAEQLKFKELADSIKIQKMYFAVDIFYVLAQPPKYGIKDVYALPDSIHVNQLAHDTIAKLIIQANPFGPMIDSGNDTVTVSSSVKLNYSVSNMTFGKYKVVQLLYDSTGKLISSDSISITRTDTTSVPPPPPPPPSGSKFVKVNLYGGTNPYTTGNWNNWNVTGTNNIQSSSFMYDDGTASSVNALLSYSQGIADNGASFGGTMCPPQVLRYTTYSTSTRQLTIKGLSNSNFYDIEFYAARTGTGNSSIFTINGVNKTVVTDNNTSVKVSFTGVVPVNGQIVVSIARVGSGFNYLNGFTLTENTISQSSIHIVGRSETVSTFHSPSRVTQVMLYDNSGKLLKSVKNPDVPSSITIEQLQRKYAVGLPLGIYYMDVRREYYNERSKFLNY
jgi:hypothetical protein